MSKYIDADEMLKHLNLMYDEQDDWREPYNTGVLGAINYIKHRAKAMDIAFCKECKYKRINEDGETRYYYCALEDRPNRQWSVDDTDYCSWGEVRDE